jgi:hypothetical protein
MPQVGLEPTIAVFERAKAVHASDRAATVLGSLMTISVSKRTLLYEVNYVNCHVFYTGVLSTQYFLCWHFTPAYRYLRHF